MIEIRKLTETSKIHAILLNDEQVGRIFEGDGLFEVFLSKPSLTFKTYGSFASAEKFVKEILKPISRNSLKHS